MAERIKSAIKQHRQSLKRKARNQKVRGTLRTITKKLYSQIEGGEKDGALNTLKSVVRSLDKAATKGVIHKRKASRLASRLSRRVERSFGRETSTTEQ